MIRSNLFKKSFFCFLLFFISLDSYAQSGIFFQAIARDNNTNPARDRKIYIQTKIIQSSPTGNIVLVEEHQTNTDAYGVFSIMVGNGLRVGGSVKSLSTINWASGPYYLNIKIAITPIAASNNWDYSKEWVDLGTTIFGTVPFSLYSASTAKIDEKLYSSDTSKMLEPYAKGKAVQILSTIIDTKLATKDTSAMLAPYAKTTYTDSALRTKLNTSDTIRFTKKIYTDSALLRKLNMEDTFKFTKQLYTDSALRIKMNNEDTIKYTKILYTDAALRTKLNATDTINYTKVFYSDSALRTKMNIFDTSVYAKQFYVDAALSNKLNNIDSIKYTKKLYSDSALLTKLSITGSAASLTNFPILNQNTTGNAAFAIYAGNITATSNTTLISLSNLNTVGTITTGIWSSTTIDIAHGGTGLTSAGLAGQTITTSSSGTLTWTNVAELMGAHYIGESFGGGRVFHVYDNGKHGLIVSTEDQSSGGVLWYNGSYITTNAFRDGVNAGLLNTERIILSQGAGNYAAQLAANYKGGGYGDWYLPSAYELGLLHLQRALFFTGSNVIYYYFSSNENPNNNKQVMCYRFTPTIYNTYLDKLNNQVRIRAIRAF
jgi:hypothetical protein